MKKTLKLIPAICMLVIAAVLVSTATYAWFSMNTSVEATGLNVEAVSDGSLYIYHGDNQPNYDDIVDGTVDLADYQNNVAVAAGLKPTSTVNVQDWFADLAIHADNYASNETFDDVTSTADGTYYLKKTVWVRSENDFDTLVVNGVTINATATGTNYDDVLEKSITVAFKVTHYTPVSGSDVTVSDNPVFVANEATTRRNGGVAAGTNGADPAVAALTFVAQSDVASSTPAIWTKPANGSEVANNVFEIEIYVYFDGQSQSCYSNAMLTAGILTGSISVSFGTTQA